MNKYNIQVSFENGIIISDLFELVVNDYNSAELNFKFDKEGKKVFKLLYPNNEIYVDEIIDNKILLKPGILNQNGKYKFEVSVYGDDNRLTTTKTSYFDVRLELVDSDEIVVPQEKKAIIDTLINDVKELESEIERKVEEGEFNGATFTPSVSQEGVISWTNDKNLDNPTPVNIKGEKGEKGDPGEPGKDAKINGVNALNLVAGENITTRMEGNNLHINAKDTIYDDTTINRNIQVLSEAVSGHDRDIQNIDNKIETIEDNIQEQEENINHLDDIKANKDEIPDTTQFVKKTTNDLTNYYLKSETYTQQEIDELIGAIKTVSMKIVPERPATGEANIIYLVPSTKATTQNIYNEYIYVNDTWELIGSTEIDLSNYATKEELNSKQNILTKSDKDNLVKESLVNNANQLNDEEKLKIETWLGLSENYLTYYNETPYQVNKQYIPAHKKYVDDTIASAITNELGSEF